jgi:DNA polymerase-3 subunit epsilon
MSARYLAVVDVETTGLGNKDRVVEVAVVTIDSVSGEVIDEFDSLVNPMRDVGPVHVHGVTPSMVSAAPTFDEVAAALESRLTGAVLVAHNLSFDSRMLTNEYARLGAVLHGGQGICTLRLSGKKLNLACDHLGISLGQHHRALADARATAELVRRIAADPFLDDPASVKGLSTPHNPRTLRREGVGTQPEDGYLPRVVSKLDYPPLPGAVISYLDMLDWVLDDLVVTATEREELINVASSLGLTGEDVERAHSEYLEALITAANRDGIITAEEERLIGCVADLLDVTDAPIPDRTATEDAPTVLNAGMTVCFTGTAVVGGTALRRGDLEEMAAGAGMIPVSSVTGKLDLLVAADPLSMSSKTKKARQLGVPVVSVTEFVTGLDRQGR